MRAARSSSSIAACALIVLAIAATPLLAAPAPADALLAPIAEEPLLPAAMMQAGVVKRARTVAVRPDVLRGASVGTTLPLTLFDDLDRTLVVDRVHPAYGGRIALQGTVDGMPDAQAVIIAGDDHVTGWFRVPGRGAYRIMPTKNGHAVVELDESRFPECGNGTLVQDDPPGPVPAGGETCDDGTVLDLIVLFTELAEDEAAGSTPMAAEAALAVELANLAYRNSGIVPRLRLVDVRSTFYPEDGSYSQHLNRLQTDGDESIDEAHDLRDEFGADLVALLVADSQFCGVAYLHDGTPSSGFSVTTWWCAASALVLAHEIGHNQGACHAPGDGGGCESGGFFEYSWGHRYIGSSGNTWRTVMAYAPGNRIPHFSNPDVVYDLQPTGLPVEDTDPAHNAMTINELSPVIANFRCSVDTCETAKLRPASPTFNADFGASMAARGAVVVVGAPRDDVFTEDIAGFDQGTASIFRVQGNVGWVREFVLVADDGKSGDTFGAAVAIGENLIAVGAPKNDDACAQDPNCDSGSVYVYRFTGEEDMEWVREAKLTGPGAAAGDGFGGAVALRGDTLLIGAPGAGGTGAVYVYRRLGGPQPWQLQQTLTPAQLDAGDGFGGAVALGEGVAVVGARGDDDACPGDPACDSGAAYVYRDDGGWSFEAKLTASAPEAFAWLGTAVALGGDVIALGAPGTNLEGLPDETDIGAVHLYRYDGASWPEEERIFNPDVGVFDQFGDSVAVDGDLVLVGTPRDDDVCPEFIDCDSGSAFLFQYDGASWPQLRKLEAHDADPGDFFGSAVGLVGDIAFVGAARNFVPLAFSGAAFVFPSLLNADCDGNGLDDFCEIASPFSAGSAELLPVEDGTPLVWTIPAPPAAATDVTFRFRATADLDESNEYLDVQVNTTTVGRIYQFDGFACLTPPQLTSLVVERDVYNDAFGGGSGDVTVRLVPSADVGDACVPISYVQVSLEYGTVSDCNGNAIPDSCDITSGRSADANGNGVPDECEVVCPQDLDGSGFVDFADLLAVLANWGPCPIACDEDLDGDGEVGFADLLAVLSTWGPCA